MHHHKRHQDWQFVLKPLVRVLSFHPAPVVLIVVTQAGRDRFQFQIFVSAAFDFGKHVPQVHKISLAFFG